jgi:hypothetical protein
MKQLGKFWIFALILCASFSNAQHLRWRPKKGQTPCTAIYGEITVLATNKTIYFCGCNWWPGNPAGGYTGIQDPGGGRHNMIFSIWDTSRKLHPHVVEADRRTKFSRFGGEGSGAHTHLDYDWPLDTIYRFYATKTQDATGDNTLTRLYFYDELRRRWVHEATISSPNDWHDSVRTFGGSLNAFLENWSGEERSKPKLALYRLWVGSSPDDLVNVTEANGDGNWGVLDDTFYLAEGSGEALAPVFALAEAKGAHATRGKVNGRSLKVRSRTVPEEVVQQLKNLPRASAARGGS